MPPYLIDLSRIDDVRDAVHRAVQALAEGGLVAFPTETVYSVAVSALDVEAVDRLARAVDCRDACGLTLAVRGFDDAMDYAPHLAPAAQRLARRVWPGPMALSVDADDPDSAATRLPGGVRRHLGRDGKLTLRVPDSPLLAAALKYTLGPVVLAEARLDDGPPAIDVASIPRSLADELRVVLDGGPCVLGQPATVVEADGDELRIVSPGALDEETLRSMSNKQILFVCTGNTCRSPMAEALMKKKLAARLGCELDELGARGFTIGSAGMSAMPGGRASYEAVETLREAGLDLESHRSRQVTETLARQADVILTMTRGHRLSLLSHFPDLASKIMILCEDGRDVADPVGHPLEAYERAAAMIDAELDRWIDQVLADPSES